MGGGWLCAESLAEDRGREVRIRGEGRQQGSVWGASPNPACWTPETRATSTNRTAPDLRTQSHPQRELLPLLRGHGVALRGEDIENPKEPRRMALAAGRPEGLGAVTLHWEHRPGGTGGTTMRVPACSGGHGFSLPSVWRVSCCLSLIDFQFAYLVVREHTLCDSRAWSRGPGEGPSCICPVGA